MILEKLKKLFGRPRVSGDGDLPVITRDFWTLGQARSALRLLEQGNFLNAAIMVDAMGRDDRLVGVMNTRIEGLLGLPLEQVPADPRSAKSRVLAGALAQKWDEFFPDSTLTELVRWGLYTGLGVGELIWDRGEDYWQPRLKVWHSQFIYWRWDTRSYWIITEKEPVELTPGDGHWVLFAPFGMHYAHLHGLVRPLMQPWQIRQDAYRDWARYSEVHGLPLVKAKIPANANAQDKREFVSDISGRGNEAVIALPQRDGAGQASFDIDLMEAKAESHKAFDLLIARTETSMAVTVLGQNLSTEVKGGSFAAAKVHDSVRHDLLDADAKALERCIRAQVLRPWAEYNFGDAALAPIPKITTEPVTDRGTTAKAFSDLATSLYSFAQAGAPVDQRAVLEEFGIPTTIETPAPLSGPESGGSKPAEEDSEQKETPAAEPPAKTRARSTEAVVH